MVLPKMLVTVWKQVLVEPKKVVQLDDKSYPVKTTRRKGLRTIESSYGLHRIDGIEQNPETKSRWAGLARQGKRVIQISCQGRYIGNVVEGRLSRYGAWQGLRLPTECGHRY